mgnify:CR=1 FL=1
MSVDTNDEIARRLRYLISQSGREFGQFFKSEEDFLFAVATVRLRYDYVSSMAKDDPSLSEKVCEYFSQRRIRHVEDDSVNQIPLGSLVIPLVGRQSGPNGLVALPSRQDVLVGSRRVFPHHEVESDLINKTIDPDSFFSISQNASTRTLELELKRIRAI